MPNGRCSEFGGFWLRPESTTGRWTLSDGRPLGRSSRSMSAGHWEKLFGVVVMRKAISGLVLATVVYMGTASMEANAQDTLPVSSGGTLSRQAYNTAQMQKHQIRVARAQYRSNLRLLEEATNNWLGHDPQRPTWNPGFQFNVPYQFYYVPTVPVGRSVNYYGQDYRAY